MSILTIMEILSSWQREKIRLKVMGLKLKAAIASLLLPASTGCIVVGGYSSERGWFIWPGTFVLLGIALLFVFLFRRRR